MNPVDQLFKKRKIESTALPIKGTPISHRPIKNRCVLTRLIFTTTLCVRTKYHCRFTCMALSVDPAAPVQLERSAAEQFSVLLVLALVDPATATQSERDFLLKMCRSAL